MLRIGPDPLEDPEVVAFLEAHVAQLRTISPPESTHALDLDGLRASGVRFWTAYDVADGSTAGSTAGELVGCAALKHLDETHAELKSMRTAPHRTGEGIAGRVLLFVLDQARAAGYRRVSLETGVEDFFAPARALYAKHGFTPCEPFAGYWADPLSVFLTRTV